MNAKEVATILGLFSAAYPNATVTEETAYVWAEMLVGVQGEDGLAAAKTLIRTSTWFPSIAEFIAAAQSACRIRTGNQEGITPENSRTELEPAQGFTNAEKDANIERLLSTMRELVDARGGQNHWHGGPDPCPVCGGITTDKETLEKYAASKIREALEPERPRIVPRSNGHTMRKGQDGIWLCECGLVYVADEQNAWRIHCEHKAEAVPARDVSEQTQ